MIIGVYQKETMLQVYIIFSDSDIILLFHLILVYFIKVFNDLFLKLHFNYFDIRPFVILQIEFKRIRNFIPVGSNFYPTTCMRKDLKLECIVVLEGTCSNSNIYVYYEATFFLNMNNLCFSYSEHKGTLVLAICLDH